MKHQQLGQAYIEDSKNLFSYYKNLGEKAISQIEDDSLHLKVSPEINSIAIIIKHMHGNMTSRWTNFLTSDGEKDWRERDNEFIDPPKTRMELLRLWNEGWDCLFNALESIHQSDLEKIIYIRNEGHLVLEAINRQLAHYSYHIGQIVFIAQSAAGKEWQSLSIPKNQSESFNKQKFFASKRRKHFTK